MKVPPELIRGSAIMREIEAQTDRGAALISIAYLEERLSRAIRAGFRDAIEEAKFDGSTVEKRLFEGSGPLATLSAKIDYAFAVGFYGPVSYRELHLLRRVRNDFAHSADPLSFESPGIVDRCNELQLPEWVRFPNEEKTPTEPRARFLKSVHVLYQFLWTEMVKKDLVGDTRAPQPEPYTLP
jgi:DNA-binding MltR family transcriptional regulator